jgi:hypothetical protein
LHSDWDTYIPQKLVGGGSLAYAKMWATNLTTDINSGAYKSLAASWIKGDSITDVVATGTRWATDANALVCTVVMPNGAAALQKGDLYPTYYNSVVPTIEMQIAKGGYRLGNWLNMLAAAKLDKKSEGLEMVANIERDWMPKSKPLSKAQLARAALDGSCGCGKEHKH